MCSISGVIAPNLPPEAVAAAEAMNQAQFHRGPDGGGVWHDGNAVLAHRRLAIIDLAGGAQPMANEDGTLHLVFNGEIYNHAALRERLEQAGHVFRTACDTEVLLHLYEETGDMFVRELDGMFAFALWDAPRRKLLLGRDRAGQKPLHYFVQGKTLVFASELAALKHHPDFPAELDPRAAADFLSLQYVPSPRTVYTGVHKLSPASILRFFPDTGVLETEKYWDLNFLPKRDIPFADAKAELRRLVTEAVRKRLMSDVPFGVFLSGGVDSGVIAAVMTRLRAPEKTRAFTIGVADPRYDERDSARRTAAWINARTGGALEHCEKVVPESSFADFRDLFSRIGEPYADASLLPTAMLSRFARESVTMALSGDAADELFAGYDRYAAIRIAGLVRALPDKFRAGFFRRLRSMFPDANERTAAGRLRRLCGMLAEPEARQYFAMLDRCPPELRRKLFGERLRDAPDSAGIFAVPLSAKDRVEQCMETDFHVYLENDTLPKMDRASMSASLEVRDPFLDREVVEFAASLPVSYKLHGGERKYILREAFADDLDPAISTGRKRGFGMPVGAWLRGAWRDPARETLFSGPLFADGWIVREAAEKLWEEHQAGVRDRTYILFDLLALSLFLEQAGR